mmetsp:Transcript_48643/g.135944  ORF Transcript_48643/g.135944 Transcript_48643/m.135944 type:complete len:490 (+) Transcript_48643:86-1555(+)
MVAQCPEIEPDWTPRCSGFVPSCSNFSIQYNYACASIAVAIMLSHNDDTILGAIADYPEPRWAQHFLLSIVFIGSVFGMLIMGYLGDFLGVQRALVCTNVLVVFGSLASAALSWGPPQVVWGIIAASRFILGVGVGGNYPLSAAKAAEAAPASLKDAVAKTGAAFFWQGPGACAPYLLALGLLHLPHRAGVTSLQFRTLFALGAIPAFVVLIASIQESKSDGVVDTPTSQRLGRAEALRDSRHWRTLVGTAGTWFLFDVAFYGTVIFVPVILGRVFGARQTLGGLAWRAAFMSLLGTSGTIAGLVALPRIGAKALNTAGLALGCMLFVVCMLLFEFQPAWHATTFFVLCLLFLVLYSGPNVATFVLPVLAFPREVRSTFHGLSAAAAKVGAMIGSLLFPAINDSFGVSAVMATQALVLAVGVILSHLCISCESETPPVHVTQAVDAEVELAECVGRCADDVGGTQLQEGRPSVKAAKTHGTIEKQKLVP